MVQVRLAVVVTGLQPCTGFRLFFQHADGSLGELTQQARILAPIDAALKLEVQDRRRVVECTNMLKCQARPSDAGEHALLLK